MNLRITIEEVGSFPVQAFLNAIPDESFVKTLRAMARGVGASFNDADCTFPDDLDSGDRPLEGVSFSVLNEEVLISQQELSVFLREAALEYIHRFPSDSDEVLQLLDDFDRLAKLSCQKK